MPTNVDDDDLEIPELTDDELARMVPSPFVRQPGEKTNIRIDGAVGYQLRLLPSNKILARFATTLEAWPVIIETIEAGRSPRTLALDFIDAEGNRGRVSAGPFLEQFARLNNGEPHPNWALIRDGQPRRIAEV